MPASFRRRRSARAAALLALLASTLPIASCGTQADDSLGVGLLGDRTDEKAVRLLESTPPDTSAAFQSTEAENVPTNPTLLVSARAGYLSRALVRFASTALPPAGTPVDSARVEWPWREAFGVSPFTLDVHRVTQVWTESVIAPDSFPAFDAVAAVTAEIPFEDARLDTFSLDLLPLVQAWVADTTLNLGLALVPGPGEDGELVLESREAVTPPRLTVYWTTVAGGDTLVTAAAVADTHVLETTPSFVPLTDEPRRLVVSRGFPSRSFVRFSWEDLGPRATVHRAEMVLHPDPDRSAAQTMAMSVRRVLAEPWEGYATVTGAQVYAVTSVTSSADSVVFDMTELIRELPWEENHGFQVRTNEERSDTDYIRFHAHDTEVAGKAPSLRIWYTPGDEEDGT